MSSTSLPLLALSLLLSASTLSADDEPQVVRDTTDTAVRRMGRTTDSSFRTLSSGIDRLATVLDMLGVGFGGPQFNPTIESTFSLSKQIGLNGVNAMITQISEHGRGLALDEVRSLYCERLAACNVGRNLAGEKGPQEAEEEIDNGMKYVDSALLGIRGHDCDVMYRGCTDFH